MAKVDITAGKYVDYLKKVTAKIASEKDYITELDAAGRTIRQTRESDILTPAP